jgi:hypothetical protein
VAATDPDRAERFAQSITEKGWKAAALADTAKAVAAIDPDRAERLSTDAERICTAMPDFAFGAPQKKRILVDVAEAVAATDPGRAERIANSIREEKDSALTDFAEAVVIDPDRAERIVQSIPGGVGCYRAKALAAIAKVVAATDPGRSERLATDAERIAQSITDQVGKASVLLEIAETYSHRRIS